MCSALPSVLITGGAGFLGSNFVRFLLKQYPGIAITVLDKLTYAGRLENLHDFETATKTTIGWYSDNDWWWWPIWTE